MVIITVTTFFNHLFQRTFLVSLIKIVNLLDIVSMGTLTSQIKKLTIASARILFDKVYRIPLPALAMAGQYLPVPSIHVAMTTRSVTNRIDLPLSIHSRLVPCC